MAKNLLEYTAHHSEFSVFLPLIDASTEAISAQALRLHSYTVSLQSIPLDCNFCTYTSETRK